MKASYLLITQSVMNATPAHVRTTRLDSTAIRFRTAEDIHSAILARERSWLPMWVRAYFDPSPTVLAMAPANPRQFSEQAIHDAFKGTQVYPGFFKRGDE